MEDAGFARVRPPRSGEPQKPRANAQRSRGRTLQGGTEKRRQPFSSYMQAILITSSLLIVAAMLGSLAWLAVLRDRAAAEAVPSEPADSTSA
jgi:hypothetical protein